MTCCQFYLYLLCMCVQHACLQFCLDLYSKIISWPSILYTLLIWLLYLTTPPPKAEKTLFYICINTYIKFLNFNKLQVSGTEKHESLSEMMLKRAFDLPSYKRYWNICQCCKFVFLSGIVTCYLYEEDEPLSHAEYFAWRYKLAEPNGDTWVNCLSEMKKLQKLWSSLVLVRPQSLHFLHSSLGVP